MATTIDLKAYNAASAFAEGDLKVIQIGGKTLEELKATLAGGVITVPGYGTLTQIAGALTKIDFKADAAAPAGEYKFILSTGGTVANFGKIDLSAITGATTYTYLATDVASKFTTGAGNDTIDLSASTVVGATVSAGAGNDTITAPTVSAATTIIDAGAGDDVIITTANSAVTVTGGTGADTFNVGAATTSLTVKDYRYSENDKVVSTVTGGVLSADGVFNVTGGKSAIKVIDANDNVYKVKAELGSTKMEYWTATSTDKVVMDGSKVTDKMVIDASNALNAVVTGGYGADSITLGTSGTQKATLSASAASGNDTIAGFDYADDVLNLTGNTTIKDLKFDGSTGGTVSLGGSVLTGIGNATSGILQVQENGGDVKKVGFAGAASGTITGAADYYIGDGTAMIDLSADTTDGAVINLYDTNKYIGIASIKGGVNGGVYIGAETVASSLDFTAAKKEVQVLGGTKADSITLSTLAGADGVRDTVWFGAGVGNDTVTNFDKTVGFGEKTDVLYLYDVEDVTKLTFDTITAATNLKVNVNGSDYIDLIGVVDGTSKAANVTIKDKAGKLNNFALGLDAAATITADGADYVIGKAAGASTVKYTAATKDDLVVNLYDTDKYKNILNIDLTGVTGKSNTVIGSSIGGAGITLGGAAGTTNEVLGGGQGAVAGDSITAAAGATDVIWFGDSQGKDQVSSFVAKEDKIRFFDKSVAEIAYNYNYDVTKGFVNSNGKDELKIAGDQANTSTITILDKNNTEVKAVVGATAAALTYNKDAKLYFGNAGAATVSASGSDAIAQYLGNGVDGITVTDTYFTGVKDFNASGATGDVVLIGSMKQDNHLTGGKTNSALYGGGISADTLTGFNGGVDQFWFGVGDGADEIDGGLDSKDTILLHNVTSIADVKLTVDAGSNKFTIALKDGSALEVTDSALSGLTGGLTFQLGTDASAAKYTYDTTKKEFVTK